MKITLETLKALNACRPQVDLFASLYPDGVEVTEENALAAVKAGLDIDWLAQHLLTGAAREAYGEATAVAWKAYDEACDVARQAYLEASGAAWKAYSEACAVAFVAALNAHA